MNGSRRSPLSACRDAADLNVVLDNGFDDQASQTVRVTAGGLNAFDVGRVSCLPSGQYRQQLSRRFHYLLYQVTHYPYHPLVFVLFHSLTDNPVGPKHLSLVTSALLGDFLSKGPAEDTYEHCQPTYGYQRWARPCIEVRCFLHLADERFVSMFTDLTPQPLVKLHQKNHRYPLSSS